MKKKVIATLVSAMMLATVLAGCGAAPSAPAAEPEAKEETTEGAEVKTDAAEEAVPASDDASGDVTIWYYWETVGHQEALDHIIQEFNGQQDKIKVQAKYVPFADFKKQLSVGASAGELPDIVILDNPDHASYAAMGIFADITDRFDVSTYYPGPVNSCTLDGKLYGVPFGSNDLVLFYNEDMLAEAGCEVPKTWDELLDVATKTTKGNVYGFAHCALQNEEGTFNFLPWVWSTGQTSYEIDSEGGIKALEFEKKLVDAGIPVEQVHSFPGKRPDIAQFVPGQAVDTLGDGEFGALERGKNILDGIVQAEPFGGPDP